MKRTRSCLLALSMSTAGWSLSAAAVAPGVGDTVNGAWQHHQLRFEYTGSTTLYTCSGLESKVQLLLTSLGARKGATVRASGCLGGSDAPTRQAWVSMEFDTLAAVDAAQASIVTANWAPLKVESHRPSFMGEGDCELVDAMREVIVKSFSFRGLDYSTRCVPHGLNPDSYAIKGEVLRAMPKPAPAAAS